MWERVKVGDWIGDKNGRGGIVTTIEDTVIMVSANYGPAVHIELPIIKSDITVHEEAGTWD